MSFFDQGLRYFKAYVRQSVIEVSPSCRETDNGVIRVVNAQRIVLLASFAPEALPRCFVLKHLGIPNQHQAHKPVGIDEVHACLGIPLQLGYSLRGRVRAESESLQPFMLQVQHRLYIREVIVTVRA